MKAWNVSLLLLSLASCSRSGVVDSAHDAGVEPRPDAAVRDASSDRYGSGDAADVARDRMVPTTALLRLANWSPDAPGVDFCLSPHQAGLWSGPILAGSLGPGNLAAVSLVDTDTGIDSGIIDAATPHDASEDARDGAQLDAFVDGASTALDASGDAAEAGASTAGVPFPGTSPYVTVAPGQYDVRVVAAGVVDCSSGPLADKLDLAPLVAGTSTTLALVGDVVDIGTDPPVTLVALSDDVRASPAHVLLRFVNAVPSVTSMSLVHLTGSFSAILSSTQFGEVGADSDAGVIDTNDYVSLASVSGESWFLVNANGGASVLAELHNVSIASGSLATVVAIGGESGATQAEIGILLCLEQLPILASEAAKCSLLESDGFSVPACPACMPSR